MSPLRLEEEVNTALNSGQTYRQVGTTPVCAHGKANLGYLQSATCTLCRVIQSQKNIKMQI